MLQVETLDAISSHRARGIKTKISWKRSKNTDLKDCNNKKRTTGKKTSAFSRKIFHIIIFFTQKRRKQKKIIINCCQTVFCYCTLNHISGLYVISRRFIISLPGSFRNLKVPHTQTSALLTYMHSRFPWLSRLQS